LPVTPRVAASSTLASRRVCHSIPPDSRWGSPLRSSYGECVDLFAPGEGITTASNAGDDGWRVGSGTSFAAPLVARVAALYLQGGPTALPAQVFAAVIDATTKNIVTNAGLGTSSNHLLFSLAWGDEVGPPPPPPTGPAAAFDVHCDDLACTFTDASTVGDIRSRHGRGISVMPADRPTRTRRTRTQWAAPTR
jgi:hypothetical protein